MDGHWWQNGVLYQIYPRSFQDSDGDGVGDLKGIRQRLDYLTQLGINAVWLSPIFLSPMRDFGYDIADHCAIDPIFGTLADFDLLLNDVHSRGIKLILDFVPNHTSNEHPWFRESRSSRVNPKRDWYIWRNAASDGAPPNNWLGAFGGSAWEWDEATGQFYYHAFLKEQPDLNWRNPEVRAAMHGVLRFWLERGVDGFRVDALWHLIKDEQFRDNPPNPAFRPEQAGLERFLQLRSADQPEIYDVVAELRRILDAYPDRLLIGEIYLPIERLVTYYGKDLSGAHLPFNFQLLNTAWSAQQIANIVAEYESALPPGGWPNWVLGNHDRPRIATRVGEAQARVAAMLLLTLRGTPTLYYGDELGFEQAIVPPEAVQDPWEKQEPGLGLGRDPCRTPMSWDRSLNAGFSPARPWLPPASDCLRRNVETFTGDPNSILNLYRRLLALRAQSTALCTGDYTAVSADEGVFIFERRAKSERLAIALNLTHEPRRVNLPETFERILISTVVAKPAGSVAGEVTLRPDEGIIVAAARESDRRDVETGSQ